MKLQCLHFNNRKTYRYITHFENEYYLFCEDPLLCIYSLVKYDKEKSTARDILLFENYFDYKVDEYDKSIYILGRAGNNLSFYKIKKNVIVNIFKFKIKTYDKVIDFFVLKGYVFFYLRSVDFNDLVLYMYDRYGRFILVEDLVLKNLLNAPLLFCFENKEVVVIEEFYIKNFFTSFDISDENNFRNNIYVISFDEFIDSIINKKVILYDILRSNKGLNYITILSKLNNVVVLFLSKPFLKNEILFYDITRMKELKTYKSEDIFLNNISVGGKVYFKATNNYDNEIIYDEKINKIFSWQKNDLLSAFTFMGLFENRYIIFKKENVYEKESVYNIFDTKNKLSKTFSAKLVIVNEDLLL